MNDEFLTRFRKPPRREFSAALYKRINTPMNSQRNFTLRRFTLAGAICLSLLAAFAFSPGVRAAVSNLLREIGGITFVGPDETVADMPSTQGEEHIVPEEVVSLAEAQAKLPFDISLPTWAPDGFTLAPSVRITYFNDQVTPAYLTWYGSDPAAGVIILMVGQRVNWLVDLDHVEEVDVNGEPAGLTGGNWDVDTGEWTGHDMALTWMRGDAMYRLSSPGVPVEDLIRMAESIP